MSQERFDAALSRLASQLDLDDLPDLIHRGRVNVAGTDVLLGCAPDGSCRLVIDLGPMPDGDEPAILRRLLELNLRRAGGTQLALGLHPKSGHIVGVVQVAIEAVEPEGALWRMLSWDIPSWVARLETDLQAIDPTTGPRSTAEFQREVSV